MSISWLFTNNLFCALLLAFHGTCQTDKSQNKAGENARSLVVWFKILATLSHSKCEIGWGSSQAEKGFMINVKLAPKKSWWLWPKKKQCNPFQSTKDFERRGEQEVWVSEQFSVDFMEKWRKKKIFFILHIVWGVQQKNSEVLWLHKGFWHPKKLCVVVTVAVPPCKFSLWASREIRTEGMSTVLPDRGP